MILLFSNRKINLALQGTDMFLPCENPIGGENVLLATANAAAAGDWIVNLVPSPPQGNSAMTRSTKPTTGSSLFPVIALLPAVDFSKRNIWKRSIRQM
jgi:hypothetical protein